MSERVWVEQGVAGFSLDAVWPDADVAVGMCLKTAVNLAPRCARKAAGKR